MKQLDNGASNNMLWGVVAGVVLIGMIFAFNNLGKTHKVQVDDDEEQTEEVTDTRESSSRNRSSRTRNSHSLGSLSRTRNRADMTTASFRGFNEGKSGDMLRAAGNSFIYGIITNEQGAAIPGATIYTLQAPIGEDPTVLRTVTSDYQGSYTVEKLNDSSMRYTVVANAEGYTASRRNITLRDEPQRADFQLRKGTTVQGIVLDKTTSEPIAGATVYMLDYYPPIQTQSGGDGKFVLENVPQSRSRNISAKKDGYVETGQLGSRMMMRMTNRNANNQNGNNEITLLLQQAGGTIRGTVVDLNNKPVAGAKVKLDSNFLATLSYPGLRRANIITKEDGQFEAKGLPPNTDISICAVKGMEGEKQSFTLQPQEVKENVVLTVPTSIFVSGKVIRADNRQPVPGTEIGYDGISGKKTVIADDHGEFFFHTMTTNGEYKIYVDAECMVPSESEDLSTTEVARFIVRKLPKGSGSDNVTIRLISTPAIIGTVTTANGSPAKFAVVQATHQTEDGSYSERTTTNHLGEYHFNLNEKIGGRRSIIYAIGNGADAKVVTRSKKRTTANLKMETSRLSGRLLLSDQSPLAGVSVSMVYVDSQSKISLNANRMFTSNNGRFSSYIGKEVDMVLLFNMPDGQLIDKSIDSSQVAGKQMTFVYDPAGKSVSMTSSSGNNNNNRRNGNWQGNRGGQNNGRNGGGNRQQQPNRQAPRRQ